MFDPLGRSDFSALRAVRSNALECTMDTVLVHAVSLERDSCEIIFPRVVGYRIEPVSTKGGVNRSVRPILDPHNPTGSTKDVHFHAPRRPFTDRLRKGEGLWKTRPARCHVNLTTCDSSWEADFCHLVEKSYWVRAYVKNEGLGFEVPYRTGTKAGIYRPDFIFLLDDGKGEDDPLHIVVEIKGYRREDASDKASTMENYWIPGVNSLGTLGRWAFIELGGAYGMEGGFDARRSIRRQFEQAMRGFLRERASAAAKALIQWGGTEPNAKYIPRRRSEPVE